MSAETECPDKRTWYIEGGGWEKMMEGRKQLVKQKGPQDTGGAAEVLPELQMNYTWALTSILVFQTHFLRLCLSSTPQ